MFTIIYSNNQLQILGRTMRVDHCEQYKAPNADMTKVDELTAMIRNEGCAPSAVIKTEIKTEVKTEVKEEKQVLITFV